MSHDNRREFYRVEYPGAGRATIDIGGRSRGVVDCSETGLRYALDPDDPLPTLGDEVSGTIRFRSGPTAEVTGTVRWIDGRDVAVALAGDGVSFGVILAEQRYLRKHAMKHL